jgi:DegV family protein with EDD domain
MSQVAIVTDSVASIPDEMLEELHIHWVPYYIHRGQEVLRDLVTVQPQSFYEWLGTAVTLPTTAAPGPGDYLQIYEKLAASGVREIASLHITAKGSAAYQAAKIAQATILERVPDLKIAVIDTMNVAMCQGWLVVEAAREALNGKPLIQITEKIHRLMPLTRMIQTADTLKYLHMGGRIGQAQHLVGSLLSIKPLIGMEDGEIVALGKARGRSRAYKAMVDWVVGWLPSATAVSRLDRIRIAYVHVAAREEAEKLREMVESRVTAVEAAVVESIFAELSPALGIHSGPGTTGLCLVPVLE